MQGTAGLAHGAAKRAARLKSGKLAFDDRVAATHRAKAHGSEIEVRAKRRLADEYDAAQARGGVARAGEYERANVENDNVSDRPESLENGESFQATVSNLGQRHDHFHEARPLRDAEFAEPGNGAVYRSSSSHATRRPPIRASCGARWMSG